MKEPCESNCLSHSGNNLISLSWDCRGRDSNIAGWNKTLRSSFVRRDDEELNNELSENIWSSFSLFLELYKSVISWDKFELADKFDRVIGVELFKLEEDEDDAAEDSVAWTGRLLLADFCPCCLFALVWFEPLIDVSLLFLLFLVFGFTVSFPSDSLLFSSILTLIGSAFTCCCWSCCCLSTK